MAERVPLFSVCIPTYNRAPLLRTAVQSVLDQSLSDFELIVVDNASADDTVAVLSEFNTDKLRVARYNTTVSMYANHNRCLELARAPWLVFLHSDEQLTPDALAHYRDAVVAGPDVTMLVPSADRTVLRDMQRFWGVDTVEGARAGALVLSGVGSVSATCFLRSALEDVGGFAVDKEVEYAADHDLYSRLAAAGARFRFVGAPIGSYKPGPHQATHSYTKGSAATRALRAVVRRMAARPRWEDTIALLATELAHWPPARAASVVYLLSLGAPARDYSRVAKACRRRSEVRRSRPYAMSRLIHLFGSELYLRALDARASLR